MFNLTKPTKTKETISLLFTLLCSIMFVLHIVLPVWIMIPILVALTYVLVWSAVNFHTSLDKNTKDIL